MTPGLTCFAFGDDTVCLSGVGRECSVLSFDSIVEDLDEVDCVDRAVKLPTLALSELSSSNGSAAITVPS